jgi:hypothetical protein
VFGNGVTSWRRGGLSTAGHSPPHTPTGVSGARIACLHSHITARPYGHAVWQAKRGRADEVLQRQRQLQALHTCRKGIRGTVCRLAGQSLQLLATDCSSNPGRVKNLNVSVSSTLALGLWGSPGPYQIGKGCSFHGDKAAEA